MADYDNTNTFALFKNDKEGVEKRPDYKGNLNVDGVEYWVSAWIRTASKTGNKFLSGQIKPKEDKPAADKPKPDFDDEVPF
jgi:hypothetical protein